MRTRSYHVVIGYSILGKAYFAACYSQPYPRRNIHFKSVASTQTDNSTKTEGSIEFQAKNHSTIAKEILLFWPEKGHAQVISRIPVMQK